jgi:hypothetical protein
MCNTTWLLRKLGLQRHNHIVNQIRTPGNPHKREGSPHEFGGLG